MMMMELIELRSRLQELLADEIGSYRLSNGAGSTPAIVALNSGDPVNDRACIGLELIIVRTPAYNSKATYNGTQVKRTWQLFLVQWLPSPGQPQTIGRALEKIGRNFVGAWTIPTRINPPGNPVEEVIVKIPDLTEHTIGEQG